MTIRKDVLVTMAFMLMPACNVANVQDSGAGENRSLADLPRISRGGTDYPYTRYVEATRRPESHGQIFYFYPTTNTRNRLVALQYEPGTQVSGIDVEEILGSDGLVVNEGGQIRIEFLPISLPHRVAGGQEWRMEYIDREFACESRAAPGQGTVAGQIAVSCASAPYRLNFTFDRERGVTEFQDFCGDAICTFRLTDPLGLLSRATLEYMELPNI